MLRHTHLASGPNLSRGDFSSPLSIINQCIVKFCCKSEGCLFHVATLPPYLGPASHLPLHHRASCTDVPDCAIPSAANSSPEQSSQGIDLLAVLTDILFDLRTWKAVITLKFHSQEDIRFLGDGPEATVCTDTFSVPCQLIRSLGPNGRVSF